MKWFNFFKYHPFSVAVGVASLTFISCSDNMDNTEANNSDLSSVLKSAYTLTSGDTIVYSGTFSSSTADENAIQVSGGTITLIDCSISKDGGDTEDSDGSSFYGINAAILATSNNADGDTGNPGGDPGGGPGDNPGGEPGDSVEPAPSSVASLALSDSSSADTGTVIMKGGTITTNAVGANAIVAYAGKVIVSDVSITCSQNLSRGIHATGGGSIEATNLNISTSGGNSSVIALDRGGGDVDVHGGNYECSGIDCAVLYSTGDLTVSKITGMSEQGEIGIIEGDNFIEINNSDITSGSSERGMMIMQSGSGDSEGYNGSITASGGTLTMTSDEAPLIEITTNVTGTVILDDVSTNIPSNVLMSVDFNDRWDTYGATGVLTLSGGATYKGDIATDTCSSAIVTVESYTIWNGAYDSENTGVSTQLTLDGGTWNLTGDSFVDEITLTNDAIINKNGYTLTCSSIENTSGSIND